MMNEDVLKEMINKDFQQKVPTSDFSNNVMDKIHHLKENKKVIEPLISKRVWWAIGSIYSIIVLLVLSSGVEIDYDIIKKQFDAMNIDYYQFKESLQIFFTLMFVICSLILFDMLSRKSMRILPFKALN